MPSEIKIAGAWAAYAVGLLLTSAAAYVFFPPSPGPKLSLTADPDGFDQADRVEIRARLDGPAPRPIAVTLDLSGDALIGQDYEMVDSDRNPLTIAIGERESPPLILRKRSEARPDQGQPRVESSKIVVTGRIEDGAGISLEQPIIDLPIEVTRFGPPPEPYVVTLQGSGESFHERSDKVTITFTLDRPVESPIALEYRLGGTARQASDYKVSGPNGSGTQIRFAPGQTTASIVLERRPPSESRRGEGDREITVTFAASPRFNAGSVNTWRVALPDPRAELTWSVDPSGTIDASQTTPLKLRLAISTPRKEAVALEYRVAADPDVKLEGPSGGSGDMRSIRINPGQLSAEETYQIVGGDTVGGPTRHLRFEPRVVIPPDLKEAEKLGALDVPIADVRPLSGHLLVVLVWNDDVVRSGEAVREELSALVKLRGDKLVGGTVMVLAADRTISRAPLGSASLQDLKPFPADADPDGVLETALKAYQERIAPRLRGNAPPIALVWQDYGTRAAVGVGKERFSGFPEGSSWDLFWVGPSPDRSRLAKVLQSAFPVSGGKPRFHPLEDPAKRLSGSLSGLLRSAP